MAGRSAAAPLLGILYGGWDHRDLEEVASPLPISDPSGDLGAATPLEAEASKETKERKPGRHQEANGKSPRDLRLSLRA